MTRSAKEALSESQLALGERCERMLASRAWQHANVNYFGVERRLELIVEAGLPPMTVVSGLPGRRTLRPTCTWTWNCQRLKGGASILLAPLEETHVVPRLE